VKIKKLSLKMERIIVSDISKKLFPKLFLTVFLLILFLCIFGCTHPDSNIHFKAVYIDLDRTALGSNKQVRPATIEAAKAFIACGGHFGIATGRTLEQAIPYISALSPNFPAILFNGALTTDASGQKILSQTPLSAETVKAVIAVLNKPDFSTSIQGIVVHYAERTVIDRQTDHFNTFLKEAGISVQSVCNLNDCVGKFVDQKGKEYPLKIMLLVEPAQADNITAQLRLQLNDQARIVIGNPTDAVIEIVSPQVNKAVAIAEVLKANGLLFSDLVAFGDSQNDIEMLRQAGVGIAMQQHHSDAETAALFITGSNDSDIIAEILRRLVMTPACSKKLPVK